MRLVWLSDIHLNFLSFGRRKSFARSVAETESDAVLVGGDIGEADSVCRLLGEFADIVRRPIYFVLGNHDYYGGSFDVVRREVRQLSHDSDHLVWLPTAEVVGLTQSTALIGHGGWADSRYGNYQMSPLILNDYFLIEDFNPLGRLTSAEAERLAGWQLTYKDRLRWQQVLVQQAELAADFINDKLARALKVFETVVFLTHVPPFREACLHQGRIADADGLPHFCSKVMGDTLRAHMEAHPDKRLIVLCGHTHCGGETTIGDNIQVYMAKAEYMKPEIQRVFEF